jgi:hypothetical protein
VSSVAACQCIYSTITNYMWLLWTTACLFNVAWQFPVSSDIWLQWITANLLQAYFLLLSTILNYIWLVGIASSLLHYNFLLLSTIAILMWCCESQWVNYMTITYHCGHSRIGRVGFRSSGIFGSIGLGLYHAIKMEHAIRVGATGHAYMVSRMSQTSV